jgi:hypothetical protein
MYELWILEWNRMGSGWAGWWCVFHADQSWKVESEASRYPKWQIEIIVVPVKRAL